MKTDTAHYVQSVVFCAVKHRITRLIRVRLVGTNTNERGHVQLQKIEYWSRRQQVKLLVYDRVSLSCLLKIRFDPGVYAKMFCLGYKY